MIQVGEGGGENRRLSVACAVAILREEKGVIIGGIKFGRYSKITCAASDRALGFNGGLTAVTCQVEKIRRNDGTLSSTLTLIGEEAEKSL